MQWINQNYLALIFIVTTVLAVVKAVLSAMGKNKAAAAVEELKGILHQTFGNVEDLKLKWKDSGAEARYGKIGEIFAKINEEKGLEEILGTAYAEWKEAQKEAQNKEKKERLDKILEPDKKEDDK